MPYASLTSRRHLAGSHDCGLACELNPAWSSPFRANCICKACVAKSVITGLRKQCNLLWNTYAISSFAGTIVMKTNV